MKVGDVVEVVGRVSPLMVVIGPDDCGVEVLWFTTTMRLQTARIPAAVLRPYVPPEPDPPHESGR
jgi:hypothetical protein